MQRENGTTDFRSRIENMRKLIVKKILIEKMHLIFFFGSKFVITSTENKSGIEKKCDMKKMENENKNQMISVLKKMSSCKEKMMKSVMMKKC
jgi:hypothetical protein